MWVQFRGLCDLFFQKRDAAFADVRAAQQKVKERKQAIAEEAVALASSEDWKNTSDKLIALQKEWKDLGSAGPRDENKLWRKFRGACDQFFTARKAIYADRDKEHKAKLKKKEALIAEIEAFTLSGKHGDDLQSLKGSPRGGPKVGTSPGGSLSKSSTDTAPPWTPSMTPSVPSAVSAPSRLTKAVSSMVKGEGAEHMARKESA